MRKPLVAIVLFFGFQLGSDRKLARCDRIVEYYRLLDKASDCIRVTPSNERLSAHAPVSPDG